MFNASQFENKVALVTGAAGGIGYQIATDLLHLGIHVCLLDSNESALLTAKTRLTQLGFSSNFGVVSGSVCDLAIMDLIDKYLARKRYLSFDFVINAAAISPKKSDGLRT